MEGLITLIAICVYFGFYIGIYCLNHRNRRDLFGPSRKQRKAWDKYINEKCNK